jgi:hypothetical protein
MNKAFHGLDPAHQTVLRIVLSRDANPLLAAPATGEWSIAEIVHHLYLVEGRMIK